MHYIKLKQSHLICCKIQNTYRSSQNPPKFPLLLLQEEGCWRNTCSKTLEKKMKMDGKERERESVKSSSITIAQDMVSWE